jgi:glycosyltransferase involved in cell wall biosynthesis
MVLLEAMALQVPIVASRVGGIPEILEDGVEAALVPPKDPEALAKAIAVLAQSPELRAQRVRAARSRVEAEFSIGGAAIEMRELYRSLRATRNG